MEYGLSIIEDKPKREWKSYRKRERKVSNREKLRMELDVILEKKLGSFEELLRMLERSGYQIKRGKHVSVRAEKMSGFIRFRSLGEGYREEALRAAIDSKTAAGGSRRKSIEQPSYSFSLMKDFEDILRQKKGKGYERWAMHFNNTQAAEVLIFLQENNIDSYEKLDALAEGATNRFHEISEEIRSYESRLKEIGKLKKAIADYSKTSGVYEAYRKAGYSRKFFEDNREEITIHKAAKKVFDSLLGEKVPK